MPMTFSDSCLHPFVGRDEIITRFKARLDYFRLFIYEGIAGIGKTSLLFRLAHETQSIGITNTVYLKLNPGEGIHSIVSRVESHFRGGPVSAYDVQGDPFARLVGVLHAKRAVLILDGLQYVRSDDMPMLARTFHVKEGDYRVLGATSADLGLSAVDRIGVHHERLGALTRHDVTAILKGAGIQGAALASWIADAGRGGCSAHPLTLRYMLALGHGALPPDTFLKKYSARSITAFRALLDLWLDRFDPGHITLLENLSRIGVPIRLSVAQEIFGAELDVLIQRGLVDVWNDDVQVHVLVAQYFAARGCATSDIVAAVAAHLRARAVNASEPMALIRAGELLAQAGSIDEAIDTLASGWESIRDLDFLEAYLKALALIPADAIGKTRLQVLSAKARMRQGQPSAQTLQEMTAFAQEKDPWTRAHALGALTYLYSEQGDDHRVLDVFSALEKVSDAPELLLPAGSLAAVAMLRVGDVSRAERLAQSLLVRLREGHQSERAGELHRLLARVYEQEGRLDLAIREASHAVAAFEAAGDYYHAATAQGFVGDLHRAEGAFEQAKEAFKAFRTLAVQCGDRNLIHIAGLADAWVSLDIGDLTHAAQQIETVENDMGVTPSGRLKRYLLTARALLEAGRGRHRIAADALDAVVRMWSKAGQHQIADYLRAQQVRSLIACDKIDEAEQIITSSLHRLDERVAAPRVATFLREQALIRLRRKEVPAALGDLSRARELFAKSHQRGEEALTLHRIARAAVEEGNLVLGEKSATEALELAHAIKHARAIALALEVQGRIALMRGQSKKAVEACEESLQALKKLGDALGALHVGESLLRAYIATGDLTEVLRLGPRVREEAERLEVREVRVRSIVLTGVALLRRERTEAAAKCFKELPERAFSPWTRALMWRFGEALAATAQDHALVLDRRERWVNALRKLPVERQGFALQALELLYLPPRHRCQLRTASTSRVLGTEQLGWLQPQGFELLVDLVNQRVMDGEHAMPLQDVPEDARALLAHLVVAVPSAVRFEAASEALYGDADKDVADKRIRAAFKLLQKATKGVRRLQFTADHHEVKLLPPKNYGFVLPTWLALPQITGVQQQLVELMSQHATVSLQMVQESCVLSRTAARKELDSLMHAGVIETVRDGRGQVYRLV